MEETASQQPPTAGTPEGKRARHRPPKSPDARQRGLAARKLQRSLEAVKASKDAAKMEEAAALLARLNGEQAPTKEPPAQLAAEPGEKPAEPKELRGAPAGVDTGRPGWPGETAVAEFAPLAEKLVGGLAAVLAPTRYNLDGGARVDVGNGQVVQVNKRETLSAALAPVMAKYLPASMNTPEAALCLAVVMVFGAPAMEHTLELFQARSARA